MKHILHISAFPKRLGILFSLLFTLATLFSCDKPKNIPDITLVSIVGDLYLANAYWDSYATYEFEQDSMDVYTIEYPIRLVNTAAGWRVDEFHTTEFG